MSRTVDRYAGLKRHMLLDLKDCARQRLVDELDVTVGADVPGRSYGQILLPQRVGARIPGIVRRDETGCAGDRIPVGFSSPSHSSDGRLRVAAFVDGADIIRITTPYELFVDNFTQRNNCMNALAVCREVADEYDLGIGVWGSAALELYSGLPYTHDESDLDLLVAPAPQSVLASFLDRINAVENRFGLRIDVEVDLDSGYGIHLKELIGNGRTLLGKSRIEVALLPRAQVLAELPADPLPAPSACCEGVANG